MVANKTFLKGSRNVHDNYPGKGLNWGLTVNLTNLRRKKDIVCPTLDSRMVMSKNTPLSV